MEEKFSTNALIYKYYSPSEYSLDALINHYFWFSKREFLNDPFDLGNFKKGRNILSFYNFVIRDYLESKNIDKNMIEQFLKEYASCSFTNSELNKQMWAYYAKDYSGWCLAFQRGKMNTSNECPLAPAIYVDDQLQPIQPIDDAKYGTDSIGRTLRKILCTKHESWRHEEEERMVIKMKSATNGAKRSWGTYQLDHIVIGNKINDAFKSIILAIARKMNVPVFMIDVSRHNFQLDKVLLQ
jgi:hypothetical protein